MSDKETKSEDKWAKDESLNAFEKAIETESEDASVWYHEGLKLFQDSKYEDAVKAFEKAIEVEQKHGKESAAGWLAKGEVLTYLKKYKDAIKAFEKVLGIEPENTDAWYGKGIALRNLQKYEDAIKAFEKTIEIEPENIDAWSEKGLVFSALQRYEDSLKALEKALEIEPKSAFPWICKGITFGGLNRCEDSLDSFEKALEIEPENTNAWINEGISLSHLKRYEDAIKAFEKAIEIEPENASAWYNKGVSLGHIKRHEDALKAFEKATEIEPNYVAAWIGKGIALRNRQTFEDSLKAFEKALAIEPENSDAWSKKGILLADLKRYENSLKAFEKALEIEPENVEAWIGKGITFSKINKYEDATKAFEKALEIEPENIEAWINEGISLDRLKRYENAIKAFEKAIEINPENVLAWISKGISLINLKKCEDALKAFENAIKVDPTYGKESADGWLAKGDALICLTKYKNAWIAFEKALEIEPENTNAWIGKGIIFNNLELYKRAIEANTKAITTDSENKYAWTNKAVAHFYLGENIQCQEALDRAFNIDPNDIKINNLLAEYHLTFGDLENASGYLKSALSDNKYPLTLYLKGKIKIEEQDYIKSSEYFKKAISLDLRNPFYLLWDSYAKYLKAELEFSSDEKRYQDMILAIIRELEKVNNCLSHDYDNNLKNISYSRKYLTINILSFFKRIFNSHDVNEKFSVKMLDFINSYLRELKNIKVLAYNYYFLGCFYYKINDCSTAVYYLKKCENLKSDHSIRKSAREAINNIWNNKIRPSIWNWWMKSPLNRCAKIFSFVILTFSLFGVLLPSLASKLIFSAYNQIFKPLFAYQTALGFSTIKSVVSILITSLSIIILSIGSFFSSLDWQQNSISLTFLTLILIFIIGSPCIQHFKSNQIEIEIRPPPAFELTPSLIEKKLKDITENIVTITEKYDYPNINEVLDKKR